MGLYADELAAKTMSDEEGQYGARSPAGRPRVRSSRSPGPPRNRYRSMSRSRSRSPGDNNSTVFVGNLNHDTDDRAMREFFTQYGKVLETKIIFNIETGRPRGFGFVKFEDPRDADDAIHNADGKVLDGRTLKCNVGRKKTQMPHEQVLDGRTLKCNIAKYPRSGGGFRGGYQGGGRGGRGPPPGPFRGGGMGGRGEMRPPPYGRRSRSRSAGRYSPGRTEDDRWGGSVSSGSRSPPPKRSRQPSGGGGDIRRPPPRRGPPRHAGPAGSGSFTGSDYSGSDSFTSDSAASRSPRRGGPPPGAAAPAAVPAPMVPVSQPPPPAAFKKELMQAKKREGELVTKVSAMEAEMQSAQAVAAQSTQAVDDLRSQLAASEKTSGKYREWLVALAECSKAVVAARTEEAAAKERTQAAESDLQLFLKEADDVLGSSTAPPTGGSRSHRGHRRRRERPAGEEQQVNGEVAAAAATAAGEAATPAGQEGGGWAGQVGEDGQDVNASAQFKPGIKFKLAT